MGDSPERRARSRPWLLNVRSVRRNARRRRRSRRGSRRKRKGRKPRRIPLRCRSRRKIQLMVTFYNLRLIAEDRRVFRYLQLCCTKIKWLITIPV